MSTQKRVGAILMALGALALVIGAIQTITDAGEPDQVAVAVTGVDPAPTTVAAAQTTTTAASTTTTAAPTTTSAAPTTTTAAPTTTTTLLVPKAADAEAFVASFSQAIADRDVDFLLATLHPVAVAQSDEATCRAFIEDEILALVDYRVTGEVSIEQRTVSVGEDTFELDPFFVVPVTFTFQGAEFDQAANLANFEGEVRWLTSCG